MDEMRMRFVGSVIEILDAVPRLHARHELKKELYDDLYRISFEEDRKLWMR